CILLLTSVSNPTKPWAQSYGDIDTSSPRQTVESLVKLSEDLKTRLDRYDRTRSADDYTAIRLLTEELSNLYDLSEVPPAIRSHVGGELVAQTLDILAQTSALDGAVLPGADDMQTKQEFMFRIEGTPLKLQRISEGTRKGEVLFDSHTVATLIRLGQLRGQTSGSNRATDTSWVNRFDQFTGPFVPNWLVRFGSVFDGVRILDTSMWKAFVSFVLLAATMAFLILAHKAIRRMHKSETKSSFFVQLMGPVFTAIATLTLNWYFSYELHLSGRLAVLIQASNVLIIHLVSAWIAWVVIRTLFDRAARRLNRREDSIDVNMLRLIGGIAAACASISVIAIGAQALGLPVISILAGFGIGGLAIALAIRPTLENLIGGFILYLDRPIRVGDFCAFGQQSGTVERIGVRSTQVRALDRTLITIPNAQFADLQLINWAACDTMQIEEVLGLRYETDMETLRYTLAEIRKMLHAHPRIDSESIRVRFAGFGAYSLDIDLRIYAQTREWNDFYAIREDVLFRIGDIVEAAGSSFAFPSQTLYFGKDKQPAPDNSQSSRETVENWRRQRRLPFPRFSPSDLKTFDGTLSYPPYGSPDYMMDQEDRSEGSETLSSERDADDPKSAQAK
ncbi:MAG: mechanosensitive ion channel family protein, partial [Pseudomonadota bacterium]